VFHRISVFEGRAAQSAGVASEVIEVTWEQLQDTILDTLWAPGTFVDGRRSIASFEQTTLLVLDIDDGCTIEQAKLIFSEYAHIIAPSKSHQKDKVRPSGNISPACDRFRLILPLNEPITNDNDFKATWFRAQALCPAIDAACKDASRFFFPSTEVVHVNSGRAFPVSRATPKQEIAPTVALPHAQLSPSVRTMKFISMGAPDGQWHAELVAACMDLKQQQWDEEAARTLLMKVTGTLDEHDEGVIEDIWANREPRHAPRLQQNDSLIKLIKQCHMLVNVSEPGDVRMVDLTNGRVHPIHPDTVKIELKGDDYKDYIANRRVCAMFTYDPRINGPLTVDGDGVYIYNTYVPPRWLESVFYKGEPLKTAPTLPSIYDKFFTHLTGAHTESQEYLLDWLATSLKSRNFTILTAIGEQGIGKGVLGIILRKLHGDNNFSECRDGVFKERFNGKLEAKTLVYVDEIDLKTKESQDRIKAVVNNDIEIEKKGRDAITVKNHASFYISSNSMDAIRLDAGDRRFSIIQLTDTKLAATPLIKEVDAVLDDANIAQLGCYLLGRLVTRDMLQPFRSARFEEVKTAGLNDWELFLLEDFVPKHAGGTPLLKDAQEAIEEARLLKKAPGWRKFADLSKKFPDMFRVMQRKNGGARILVVPREPKGFGGHEG
jgi:hypothetical protein